MKREKMLLAVNHMIARNPYYSGVLSLVMTLLVWSSYFVALRSGAQSQLTNYDMAVLRFILPALVLLPVLYRAKARILATKKRYLFGIMSGAGLPFYLLSVIASSKVQAVVGSLLIPGVAPVFVTMFAVFFYRESLSRRRFFGLFAVVVGVCLLVSAELGSDNPQLLGPGLYLVAAVLWATYTVSIKMSALSSLEVAAILNVSAAVVIVICMPFASFTSNLTQVSLQEIFPQLIIMGVFCGLVSVVTYSNAIKNLGAELSACWGALTPVLVAILAYVFLSEQLDTNSLMAMLIICGGVICANFKKRKKKTSFASLR
jgi:drug/metabolite transporter (DMT)-like permease